MTPSFHSDPIPFEHLKNVSSNAIVTWLAIRHNQNAEGIMLGDLFALLPVVPFGRSTLYRSRDQLVDASILIAENDGFRCVLPPADGHKVPTGGNTMPTDGNAVPTGGNGDESGAAIPTGGKAIPAGGNGTGLASRARAIDLKHTSLEEPLDIDKEEEAPTFKEDSWPLQTAIYFAESLARLGCLDVATSRLNASKRADRMQIWAKEFDLLIRVDGYSEHQVATILEWLFQPDNWWIANRNIRTAIKLRSLNRQKERVFDVFASQAGSGIERREDDTAFNDEFGDTYEN